MLRKNVYLGLLFLLSSGFTAQLCAAELLRLNYLASYKGVFSLFANMEIADVEYVIEDVPGHSDAQVIRQIRLAVSSERYKTVERLYPFRYLFKSFYRPASDSTLFFEHLKVSKKSKKKKHQVGILDQQDDKVQLFNATQHKELITSDNVALYASKHAANVVESLELQPKAASLTQLEQMPVDRMTMLEQVKQQLLQQVSDKTYSVTNGDELFNYRVSFQKKENLKIGEGVIPSQKIKIEAFETKTKPVKEKVEDEWVDIKADPNKPVYAHAPVYVWFSLDEQPIALKFVNRHSVGDFIIQLTEQP